MVRFFWASGLGVQNHLVFKPEDSSYNKPLAVIKFINSFKCEIWVRTGVLGYI